MKQFHILLMGFFSALLILQIQPLPAQETDLSFERVMREQITILSGDKEIAVYHAGAGLDKSYFHPLWTPDHRCITYDSPADHVHHRGLCIGWPDVSNIDFWAESNSPAGRRGTIKPIDIAVDKEKNGQVRLVEKNRWQDQNGTAMISGRYIWIFYPPQGNLQLLDVDIRLEALQPEIVFGSDEGQPRTYHGLTIRLGPFAEPRFYNSEGDVGDEACMGKPAKWCALSGLQNGGPVTAAIFDHPQNDRHPSRFFVLGTGMQFISTSPNYATPKTLKKGETWHLRYRVVAAGAPQQNVGWNLDKLWVNYAEGR